MSTKPFTDHVQVRTYECDAYGHVNNAVYLQYLQQATLDAMGTTNDGEAFWNIRRLTVEYQAPARYGDVLQIMTWSTEADESHAMRGYQVTRGACRVPVLQAQIDWDYRDRATYGPRSVPELHHAVPTTDVSVALKPFVAPHDNGSRPFRWQHTVPFYELDSTNRVGLAVYFQWLETAFFNATGLAGWTLEKMRAENLVSLQYRHDAEFFGSVKLNNLEFVLVNNPIRAWSQRTLETPQLIGPRGRLVGQRVLEVGCGRGVGLEILLALGAAHVTGFDLDPRMIDRARKRAARYGDRAQVFVGDAERLDAGDASFDAVVDYGVVHHIPDWRRALQEIARVLKPGGVFYFEDLLKGLISVRPARVLFDHPQATQFYGREFRAGLKAAGLRVQKWRQWREWFFMGQAEK